MLPFFRRKAEPKTTGDWWTDTFTPEERATIEGVFTPLGGGTAESLARSTNPTRYDRCPETFFSAIMLAATVLFWL